MQLYAGSVIAVRAGPTPRDLMINHTVVEILASSKDEAEARVRRIWEERYPPATGWYGHAINLSMIDPGLLRSWYTAVDEEGA